MTQKKRITLTIKEIADLKQGNKTIKEIQKTHDGTSMGKIRSVINKWAKENYDEAVLMDIGNTARPWNYRWEKLNVTFDENGNQLTQNYFDRNDPTASYKVAWQNLYEPQKQGDIHYVTTEGEQNGHSDGIPVPGYDFGSITQKNENGEFYIRSETIVGEGGSYVTAIRNNDFSDEDIAKYNEVRIKMGHASYEYMNKYNSIISSEQRQAYEMMREGNEEGGRKLLAEADEKAVNEIGTWEENVLDGQGYRDKLAECNVKIRISRNGNTRRDQMPMTMKYKRDKDGNKYLPSLMPANNS